MEQKRGLQQNYNMFGKILFRLLYWLFVVVSVYFIVVVLYSNIFIPKLEYKKLENIDYNVVRTFNELPEFESREQIKEQLESVFGIDFYIYREVENFKTNSGYIYRGNTFLPLRAITISRKATENNVWYAYVLAHEMAHLKFYNVDERYIEFKVVQILYDSGDEELMKLAKWIIFRHIQDEREYITNYSCAYYCYNFIYEREFKHIPPIP